MGPLRPWLLLALLWGALALAVGVWVSLDRRPPEWDYANHLERAVVCGRLLATHGLAGIPRVLEVSAFYPPVVPCAAGILALALPLTPALSQSVMLAFLALALACLFFAGRRLFDATTGLLAATIFGAAPFVVYSLTHFQLDLPLAAAVSLGLLALIRTEAFSSRVWSLLLGVVLAFGLLVKPPFAVYLVAPLAVSAWPAVRGGERARLANLGLALLVGGGLALPWYGPRVFAFPLQVLNRSFKQAALSGHPEPLSPEALFFYPRLWISIFGAPAALLLLWGLWAALRRPHARGLLLGAFLPALAVFVLIQNKNLRYVLPIFPAAALIAAAGLRAMSPAWRRGALWALGLVSVVQVGTAAFGVPPLPPWRPFGVPLVFSVPPSPLEWPHREILAAIARQSGGRPATVSVVPNASHFSVSNFRYYAIRDGLPLRMTRAWEDYPLGVEFVVLKTGELGPEFSVGKPRRIMERLAAGDPTFERMFPVIWEGPLPDGSLGQVRQRRPTPVAGASARELAARVERGIEALLGRYARDVEGLRIELAYDGEALLRGEIRQVRVQGRSARVAEFDRGGPELRVRDVRLVLEGVLINPHRLVASGEIEPLEIERFRVERLAVTEADLRAFLAGLRRLRGVRLSLESGAVSVSLAQPGPDLAARLAVEAGDGARPLAVRPLRLSVGGVPMPRILVDWIFRHFDPSPRLARLPVRVEIAPLRLEPGRLVVSGGR